MAQDFQTSLALADDTKERTLIRKVSKVSILQTARKIENDRVHTEQKLIPLT